MPLATTEKNFLKVLQANLRPGETVERIVGAGRRVAALTGERLIVSDFPLFGSPKLLLDVARDDIRGLDQVSANAMSIDLVVETASAGQLRANLPIGYSNVQAGMQDIFAQIRMLNAQAGGASYFEVGEQARAKLPIESGELRATDRNLYVLSSKTGGVERKIPSAEVVEFDFHRGRMGALHLFIRTRSDVVQLRMKAQAGVFNDIGRVGDHGEKAWAPAKILTALFQAGTGQPSYLEHGEQVLFGVRAGTGLAGSVTLDKTLRLTDRRLLLLSKRQDGGLAPSASIARDQIRNARLTRWHGQHNQSLYFAASIDHVQGTFDVSVPDEDGEGKILRLMLADVGFRFD